MELRPKGFAQSFESQAASQAMVEQLRSGIYQADHPVENAFLGDSGVAFTSDPSPAPVPQ